MKRLMMTVLLAASATSVAQLALDPLPAVLADVTRSPQVVWYAPQLTRADVAETLRRAMVEQGVQVYLITTEADMYRPGSLAFHLALAGATTYLVPPGTSAPFLLSAQLGAEGPGVALPGPSTPVTPARLAQLRRWAANVTRRAPVPLPLLVHTWLQRVRHLTTH
ncbi:hypothetical protein [Deinococcus sonorensis]|uniref:Uncharacterized protein n=1 Tax=Deinococcus sonorensis TaxID=309891 RepID=A0ABV8Y893_9DEIO